MRFIDSSSGFRNHTLGAWLEGALDNNPRGLWIQSGYFGFESIAIHQEAIETMSENHFPIHFVLGANQKSLAASDILRLLQLIRPDVNRTLTVISYSNALFHPKCYVIERQDHSLCSYIGSANLTGAGIGLNAEAGLVLCTNEGDPRETILEVSNSINRWNDIDEDGVFRIANPNDIQELLDANIIVSNPTRFVRSATRPTSSTATSPNRNSGRRPNLFPRAPQAPFTAIETISPSAPPAAQRYTWQKRMERSSAQQVDGNQTGKLRLSQAGHPIDHKTWFREVLFDGLEWRSVIKNGQAYEVVSVPFRVSVNERDLGVINLTIDHAPHRVAGQGNVPTVLAWGATLMRELTTTSHVGEVVSLVRAEDGSFSLTIQ